MFHHYSCTYMSIVIEQVVGELEFVKLYDLLGPAGASRGRVGVHVDAAGHVRVGLACSVSHRRTCRNNIALEWGKT